MELAKRLLIETRQPLCEIAIQCGCGDASRMVTMFRREFRVTPGEFRKAKTNSTIQ
ncbi:MAG: helix-turn-helix domain-containing protein [Verrucomicrobiales bacterium]